jgi:pantoate--beta-alanine ligase
MKSLLTVSQAQKFARAGTGKEVLVPTMGALHEGHAALLRHGRKLAGKDGRLVCSIFVNPTQFGPREDFARYPRTLKEDLAICRACGVDAVFSPKPEEMYAPDDSVRVVENALSQTLCGASRPGHFTGVCTIVAKLFLIFRPQVAVFGEKDWQQLAIIRRMVRDLFLPVRVVGLPTVREPDGLALSSRNRYLTPEQRAVAPGLARALRECAAHAEAGETSVARLRGWLRRRLDSLPGAVVDYAEIVAADTLRPMTKLDQPARALVAVFFGQTRLIDNWAILPPPTGRSFS